MVQIQPLLRQRRNTSRGLLYNPHLVLGTIWVVRSLFVWVQRSQFYVTPV